jgi:glycosyltransferase involved in cell wall biosynthesis
VLGRRRIVYLIDTGTSTSVAALAARALGKIVVLDTGDLAFKLARSTGRRPFPSLLVVGLGEWLACRCAHHVVVRGRAHRHYMPRPTTFAPDVAPPDARPRDRDRVREALGLQDAFVVGLVGSLVRAPRTGLSYGWDLVEALPLTSERVHAVIIGDGDAKAELEARSRALGVSRRCHFLGRIASDSVFAFISAMDAGVSTQTNDPVGTVRTTGKLPLYLACSCPVLASDVGEARAVLGPLGWTLPYRGKVDKQYPRRLAQAIDAWAADPAGAEQRRRAALELHDAAFDREAIRSRVHGVLAALLAGARQRTAPAA